MYVKIFRNLKNEGFPKISTPETSKSTPNYSKKYQPFYTIAIKVVNGIAALDPLFHKIMFMKKKIPKINPETMKAVIRT